MGIHTASTERTLDKPLSLVSFNTESDSSNTPLLFGIIFHIHVHVQLASRVPSPTCHVSLLRQITVGQAVPSRSSEHQDEADERAVHDAELVAAVREQRSSNKSTSL